MRLPRGDVSVLALLRAHRRIKDMAAAVVVPRAVRLVRHILAVDIIVPSC